MALLVTFELWMAAVICRHETQERQAPNANTIKNKFPPKEEQGKWTWKKKKSKKIRPMDGWMAGRMDFAEESPTQAKSPQPTALVVKFEPKIQWKIYSFIHSFIPFFFYFFSTFQNQQIPDFQDQWNVYLQNGLNPISKPQRFIHSHFQINKSNRSLCIFELSFQLIPIVQCQK